MLIDPEVTSMALLIFWLGKLPFPTRQRKLESRDVN
jgi:hypothetical protein